MCKSEGQLIATSAWRLRFLTLGTVYRQVVVDPAQKVISLHRRYLWLFARTRSIPFRSIKAVTYGYQDWAMGSFELTAHKSMDLFSVGLRLQDLHEVHLFYFLGDGTFSNDGPWPDWLYWEQYLTDISGTQEKESRGFAELLGKMIGVPIIPPAL
jgi:hypothetical protein